MHCQQNKKYDFLFHILFNVDLFCANILKLEAELRVVVVLNATLKLRSPPTPQSTSPVNTTVVSDTDISHHYRS